MSVGISPGLFNEFFYSIQLGRGYKNLLNANSPKNHLTQVTIKDVENPIFTSKIDFKKMHVLLPEDVGEMLKPP